MRARPSTLLLLAVAAASAGASEAAARVVLEVPAHAAARLGAVRLDVALRNASGEPVRAAPSRLAVAVRDRTGAALPCSAPPGPPAAEVELAPGARVAVAIDLGARCRIGGAGAYAVDVRYDGP